MNHKFQFDEDQSYVAEFMGGIFLIEQRMEIWSKKKGYEELWSEEMEANSRNDSQKGKKGLKVVLIIIAVVVGLLIFVSEIGRASCRERV